MDRYIERAKKDFNELLEECHSNLILISKKYFGLSYLYQFVRSLDDCEETNEYVQNHKEAAAIIEPAIKPFVGYLTDVECETIHDVNKRLDLLNNAFLRRQEHFFNCYADRIIFIQNYLTELSYKVENEQQRQIIDMWIQSINNLRQMHIELTRPPKSVILGSSPNERTIKEKYKPKHYSDNNPNISSIPSHLWNCNS